MTNDEVIEKVINVLYHDKVKSLREVLYDILEVSKAEDGGKSFVLAKDRIPEILEHENIIEKTNQNIKELTHFAKTIFENGGWIKHINEQQRISRRQESKEEFDFQISKYLAKTQWWPLIISALSLIISVGQLSTCSNKSSTNEILKKPTTPTKEVQTKMDSSEYKPKPQNDSLNLKLKVDKKEKK
jgi:hypothetical protein